MPHRRVLILTISHGASHERAAAALQKGFAEAQPEVELKIVNALHLCPLWFRLYYDSYLLPLRYCPSLWAWIENQQHEGTSTNPMWMYRRAGLGLLRFIEDFAPDVVVATEVGMCEMATLLKREQNLRFTLIGLITGVDVDRAWAQAEVDLYIVSPGEPTACLTEAGIAPDRIVACGQPIDPAFANLPDRLTIRARNGVKSEVPLILILFGGTGIGRPRQIIAELRKVTKPFQAVLITGRNERLRRQVESLTKDHPAFSTYGWINNMHEWMAASDMVITKPGASTLVEALSCGLPILALDPLPGNERRACDWLEVHHFGYWVRKISNLSPLVGRLLANRDELTDLHSHALAFARPHAAAHAARAILDL